jgi:hypothetical protein
MRMLNNNGRNLGTLPGFSRFTSYGAYRHPTLPPRPCNRKRHAAAAHNRGQAPRRVSRACPDSLKTTKTKELTRRRGGAEKAKRRNNGKRIGEAAKTLWFKSKASFLFFLRVSASPRDLPFFSLAVVFNVGSVARELRKFWEILVKFWWEIPVTQYNGGELRA